ncbi:MAG: OsmC family protein [Pseudomonadota bacterium]|nr:OsmC family protein [Pseudomonadota bacterium]
MEERIYQARTYSSGTRGRAICNSRQHHFIADDVDQDELTAGEYFLTGLTACAVNMLERVAPEHDIVLKHIEVRAEGCYHRSAQPQAVTLFQYVNLAFDFQGITEAQAQELVSIYKSRCPLYGTVATAIPQVHIEITVKA